MPAVSTFAIVNDGRTFVGTSQLYRCVLDFFSAAIWASFTDGAFGVESMALNSLYAGLKLLAQK